MRRTLWLTLSIVLLITPTASSAQSPPSSRILVRYRDTASRAARDAAEHGAGARPVHRFSRLQNLEVIEPRGANTVERVLERLRRNPHVIYAEQSQGVEMHATPNDPSFSSLWGMSMIQAPLAWDTTTGSNNVVIAVVDTGIDYSHPDLAANIWTNPGEVAGNGIDDDNNGYVDDMHGINALWVTGDPSDDNNHGTHVAGTIAAAGNNGAGVAGVNWNTKLIGCKFLDADGTGETWVAVYCLDYLLDLKLRAQNPVNIILSNNSWGGGPPSEALRDAIAAHRDAGILFVASAGNANQNMDLTPQYPSGYDVQNVIACAAIDQSDAKASFSNYGRHSVDIGAPGVSVLSTIVGNQYASFNGTSMAAPHVSGVIGLLKAQNPARSWIELRNLILAGGQPTTAMSPNTLTGRRLRAAGSNGGGSLTCANQIVSERIEPADDNLVVEVGANVRFSALNINCAQPSGPVALDAPGGTLNLVDEGFGDGTYAGNFIVPSAGTHTVTFPWSDSVTIRTAENYLAPTPVSNQARTFAGTTLSMTDNSVATVTSPFPIRLGGYPAGYTTLYVSSNGTVSFDTNNNTPYDAALPTAVFDTLVAVYWDDLNPAAGGSVVWSVLGTSPNRELVVEWRNVPHRWVVGSNGTFQVVFFESSSDVLFNYQDVNFNVITYNRGATATIGIQTSGLVVRQHSSNLASVNSGTGLLFSTSSSSPNRPPVAVDDTATTTEDTPVVIVLGANDSDPDGDPLELAWVDQPRGIVDWIGFNGSTTVSYFPDYDFTGTESFNYVLSDGRGGTSEGTVTVTVGGTNDPPNANNDSATTTTGVPVTISVLANDSDADGDPISIAGATQPANGTATVNGNGTITYTPNAGFFGTNTFSYTITDGISGNDSATVTVTVLSGLTITAVSPSTVGFGSVTLTITGTGFATGATLSFTGGQGGTPAVSSLQVQSATRIVAVVNVPSGGNKRPRYWDVTVRLPNGATATLVRGLTVIP